MSREMINLGFGVSVERIANDNAVIHNLKSDGKDVSNLGVKFLE